MDIKTQFKVGDLIRPTEEALHNFSARSISSCTLNNKTYMVRSIKRKLHGDQCQQILLDNNFTWGSPWFELDNAAIFNNKLNAIIE